MLALLCVDGSTGSRLDPQDFQRNNYLRLRAMEDRDRNKDESGVNPDSWD